MEIGGADPQHATTARAECPTGRARVTRGHIEAENSAVPILPHEMDVRLLDTDAFVVAAVVNVDHEWLGIVCGRGVDSGLDRMVRFGIMRIDDGVISIRCGYAVVL